MKTRMLFWFVAGACMYVTGCAFLDSVLGANPDGSRTPGIPDMIAPFANGILPGAGVGILALTNFYAAWRGRKWRKVAESTFDAVEAGAQAVESVKDLKKRLARAHIEAGVKDYAKLIVNKYGHLGPS